VRRDLINERTAQRSRAIDPRCVVVDESSAQADRAV
jgi:hypothetical protein